MIIRVLRYRLVPGSRALFEHAVLSDSLPRIARLPDLRFAFATRSSDDAGALITGWNRFEAIPDLVGSDLEHPVLVPAAVRPLIAEHAVAHYEALDLPPVGTGEPALLRLMTGEVPGAGEAAYFEWVRNRLWPAIAPLEGLAGAWFGRQAGEGGPDPVVGVTTWTLREAIATAGVDTRPFAVDGDTGPFHVGSVEVLDLYGVITNRVEDRPGVAQV